MLIYNKFKKIATKKNFLQFFYIPHFLQMCVIITNMYSKSTKWVHEILTCTPKQHFGYILNLQNPKGDREK